MTVDLALACGSILGALGFAGMGLLLAIQTQRTATETTRADRAEARARHKAQRCAELAASNDRLRGLLDHETVEHAERLAGLVALVPADTAEDPQVRTS